MCFKQTNKRQLADALLFLPRTGGGSRFVALLSFCLLRVACAEHCLRPTGLRCTYSDVACDRNETVENKRRVRDSESDCRHSCRGRSVRTRSDWKMS